MAKRKRDPAIFDTFMMRPRGKPGPRVIALRDKRGRFTEIMKVDRDVVLRAKRKKRKR